MTKANAELWKRQYSQAIMAAGAITDTWEEFKQKLRNAFKDAGRQEKAMTWLTSTRQRDWDLEKFNTLFEINAGRTGIPTSGTIRVGRGDRAYDIPNPQQAILINFYRQAINPQVSRQIVIAGEPRTITEWMQKVIEVSESMKRAGALFVQGIDRKSNRPPF